jgi:hypothetical protein
MWRPPTRPWSTAWASCTCACAARALREVYKFEVNTRPPRIAYRETITAPGRGPPPPQEADRRRRPVRRGLPAHRAAAARRRLRVRRRGQGRHHPGPVHPAVEKGVREVLAHGAIAGYPVVDVRVIVYDGKHHSVDSKEIAFVTAGKQGLHRRHARGAADRAGAHRARRDQRARPRHGRHHRRPVGQARHGQRHRNGWRQRHGRRQWAGAAVRAVPATRTRLNAMTAGQGRYTLAPSALRGGAQGGAELVAGLGGDELRLQRPVLVGGAQDSTGDDRGGQHQVAGVPDRLPDREERWRSTTSSSS